MLFQHFNLYPHKTVLENVTLAPIKVLGISKAEAEKTAEKFLRYGWKTIPTSLRNSTKSLAEASVTLCPLTISVPLSMDSKALIGFCQRFGRIA